MHGTSAQRWKVQPASDWRSLGPPLEVQHMLIWSSCFY